MGAAPWLRVRCAQLFAKAFRFRVLLGVVSLGLLQLGIILLKQACELGGGFGGLLGGDQAGVGGFNTRDAGTGGVLVAKRRGLAEWLANVASEEEIIAIQAARTWLEDQRQSIGDVHSKLEEQAHKPGWATCAREGMVCECPSGEVRFGREGSWLPLVVMPSSRIIWCELSNFGKRDPAFGREKVCECMAKTPLCEDGSEVDWDRCPSPRTRACRLGCSPHAGLQPPSEGEPPATPRSELCSGQRPFELLWACSTARRRPPSAGHAHAEAQEVLDSAVASMCAYPELENQFETYLDCEFVDQYRGLTGMDSGWLEEAFVTYVSGSKDSTYERQATNLVRSVALFSTRPIVVTVFGREFVPPSEWYDFPNVIVYRMPHIYGRVSFNFNKIRAMIGSRVISGVMLDTDQIVFTGVDVLFRGTRRESSSRHPWPLLPVHWMSRDYDPESDYKDYAFVAYKDEHTMRWGHAHPTWSFWALPFLVDLLTERMLAKFDTRGSTEFDAWDLAKAPERGLLEVLRTGMKIVRKAKYKVWMMEDEDMLNVNLWRDGVDKAWCKFDLEPDLFVNRFGVLKREYSDRTWFPDGVPLLFISAHNTKAFENTDWLLSLLARCSRAPERLNCPRTRNGRSIEMCESGSSAERKIRLSPADYTSKACCCVEPRWATPVHWFGTWYASSDEVPMVARGGSGKPRACLFP